MKKRGLLIAALIIAVLVGLALVIVYGFGRPEKPAKNAYPGDEPYVSPTSPPPGR